MFRTAISSTQYEIIQTYSLTNTTNDNKITSIKLQFHWPEKQKCHGAELVAEPDVFPSFPVYLQLQEINGPVK